VKGLAYVIGGVASGGLGYLLYRALTEDVHTFKETPPPDVVPPPPPGSTSSTGYKRIDALLPKLTQLANANGIPLGLLVGWIAKESAGKLAIHPQPGPGDTSMDERGFFQISPDESKKLRLDHQRLSTDSDYSLQAGIDLIHEYETAVQALNIPAATSYSAFYWLLVKLNHTVGVGQTKKWAQAAIAADKASAWGDFEKFVLSQNWKGPQPKKWLPFIDDLYRIGQPFGFGDAGSPGPAVAGDTEMHAHRRHSGTWVVDGGGRPGHFPGGRDPLPRPTGLFGLDIFVS
jgi:hypothetical protein